MGKNNKKRKRGGKEERSIHPRNKYADNPPDFSQLASLYPSFASFVSYSNNGRPRIDWTDFNATREHSRVALSKIVWYTSMVGKKSNLKYLMSKLREVGVTVVKTTEFVQGQTCRWGLAWSFMPPAKRLVSSHRSEKTQLSFILEGLERLTSAFNVLQSVESFFSLFGASCKLNVSSFSVDVSASKDQCDLNLKTDVNSLGEVSRLPRVPEATNDASSSSHLMILPFKISVFQQIPGTLLVRGSVQQRGSPLSGAFSSVFQQLEEFMKHKFCKRSSS